MSGPGGVIIYFEDSDGVIENLTALEQAIEEICDAETIAKIIEAKEKIKETKG